MGFPLYYAFDGAPPPPRSGAEHATIYPYGPFAAGDGGVVMLGLQNEREWLVFCEKVIGEPSLATDERFRSTSQRHLHRDALRTLILASFARSTAAEIVARLDDAQIANARMNTMDAVWAHPQLAARHHWRPIDTPVGPVIAALPPGRHDRFDYRMGAVPALGAHTDAILGELGFDAATIDVLKSASAV
jgi:itaconate CoA-transferase